MKLAILIIMAVGCFLFTAVCQGEDDGKAKVIKLPKPAINGDLSVEQAINDRRSVRSYENQPLTNEQIGQLLWAGQGITSADGLRAAPSAGALYPMTLFAFRPDGVFRYDPHQHNLVRHRGGDLRRELSAAALGQGAVARAPLVVVVAAEVPKTARKYGNRAVRYCDLEAGHIAQNIALQAQALGLGMVPIGAFGDDAVAAVLGLGSEWRMCYVLPIGRPAE